MSDRIICPKCGYSNSQFRKTCKRCREELPITAPALDKIRCSNCGLEQPALTNYCTKCGVRVRPGRTEGDNPYPKAAAEPSIRCFAASFSKTTVVAEPNLGAEILYIIAPGDVLPITDDEGDFYCLLLPGADKGYVLKQYGIIVEVGLEEVQQPLGFVRLNFERKPAKVSVAQPEGEHRVIHTLQDGDRLPVVEEREDQFMVQLPNGIRGLVRKADVLRTVSPSSQIEVEASGGFGELALGAVALIGIGILGGLAGNQDEARVRSAVDHSLRERGL